MLVTANTTMRTHVMGYRKAFTKMEERRPERALVERTVKPPNNAQLEMKLSSA